MPNDCENFVIVYADEQTIQAIAEIGLRLPDLIKAHPLPEHLRMYDYALKDVGAGAIAFRITSAWGPLDDLFHLLVLEYPSIVFMKNEWCVEDGAAGVWVAERYGEGGETLLRVQSMHWDEGCLEEKAHRFRKAAVTQSP